MSKCRRIKLWTESLTKQFQSLLVLVFDDFDAHHHVESFTKKLYAGDIYGFGRDQTDSFKVDLWGYCWNGMDVPQRGDESESAREIRIGRNKSYKGKTRGHVRKSANSTDYRLELARTRSRRRCRLGNPEKVFFKSYQLYSMPADQLALIPTDILAARRAYS